MGCWLFGIGYRLKKEDNEEGTRVENHVEWGQAVGLWMSESRVGSEDHRMGRAGLCCVYCI